MIRLALVLPLLFACTSTFTGLDVTSESDAPSLRVAYIDWYDVYVRECDPPPDESCYDVDVKPQTLAASSEDPSIANVTMVRQPTDQSAGKFELTGVSPGDATIDITGDTFSTSYVVHITD